MAIPIVPLEPQHLPAMVRFCQRVWGGRRPVHDGYYRWRYLEAPHQTTLMALAGSECLAALTVFERPYRIGEDELWCSETADWHCLPELRGSGIGIRLMQRATDMGRPIFAVGGSDDTRRLLPRLGWRDVGHATRFVRPLHIGPLVEAVWRRLGVPRILSAGSRSRLQNARQRLKRVLILPRPARPTGGVVTLAGTGLDGEVLGLYKTGGECGTRPQPIAGQIEWLGRAAAPQQSYTCLAFRAGPTLKGWALLRCDGEDGAVDVNVVEAFAPGARDYLWLVAEIVVYAVALGARRISALTACPALAAALRANRFWAREEAPISCWSRLHDFPPQPLHLGSNIGDAALRPYPTSWHPTAAAP